MGVLLVTGAELGVGLVGLTNSDLLDFDLTDYVLIDFIQSDFGLLNFNQLTAYHGLALTYGDFACYPSELEALKQIGATSLVAMA